MTSFDKLRLIRYIRGDYPDKVFVKAKKRPKARGIKLTCFKCNNRFWYSQISAILSFENRKWVHHWCCTICEKKIEEQGLRDSQASAPL